MSEHSCQEILLSPSVYESCGNGWIYPSAFGGSIRQIASPTARLYVILFPTR